jgi:hypothetical protein
VSVVGKSDSGKVSDVGNESDLGKVSVVRKSD